jgi:hypothetical protein
LKIHSLYVLRDPRTNVIRYVGQTSRKPKARLVQHYTDNRDSLKNRKRFRSGNWIKQLRDEGLRPVMQVVFQTTEPEYIDRLEIAAIRGLRRRGFDLTNQAAGGAKNRGWNHTEQYKKELAKRHPWRGPKSDEWKAKQSQIMKDIWRTKDTWQKGKPAVATAVEKRRVLQETDRDYRWRRSASKNKTGLPQGVRRSLKKFRTQITIAGVTINLGSHSSAEYAGEVYKEAFKMFG